MRKTLIILLIFTWYLFTNSSEVYPEPEYYVIDFGDGVIHKWSREIYYDLAAENGLNKKLNYRFENESNNVLTFRLSKSMYLNSRDSLHRIVDENMERILSIIK